VRDGYHDKLTERGEVRRVMTGNHALTGPATLWISRRRGELSGELAHSGISAEQRAAALAALRDEARQVCERVLPAPTIDHCFRQAGFTW
jgi:hypothetical protein